MPCQSALFFTYEFGERLVGQVGPLRYMANVHRKYMYVYVYLHFFDWII